MQVVIISVLIVVGLVMLFIVLSSRYKVKLLLEQNSIPSSAEITGGELVIFASQVLNIKKLSVKYYNQKYCDCYIPSKKMIILSEEHCFSNSLSAISVSAHEIGHAIQHKRNSFIWVLLNLFRFLSVLSLILIAPCIVAMAVLFMIGNQQVGLILLYILCGLVGCLALCKILTIPCEKDASKNAIEFLKKYKIINSNEIHTAKQILKNAELTYVAGLFDGLFRK